LNYTREVGDFTWDASNTQITVSQQWGKDYADDTVENCEQQEAGFL
jgi:hypothetical protein